MNDQIFSCIKCYSAKNQIILPEFYKQTVKLTESKVVIHLYARRYLKNVSYIGNVLQKFIVDLRMGELEY